jgi:hypothetical protein
MFFNDPVTVFHICTMLEIATRPICDKENRPPNKSDPMDHGIGIACREDFPVHGRGSVKNFPSWFHFQEFHGDAPYYSSDLE